MGKFDKNKESLKGTELITDPVPPVSESPEDTDMPELEDQESTENTENTETITIPDSSAEAFDGAGDDVLDTIEDDMEDMPEMEDDIVDDVESDTEEEEVEEEVTTDVTNFQTVIYGPEQIAVVLSNPELSFKEKLEEIGKFAKGELGMLANGLISYGYSMSKERGIVDAKVGVSNNYSLYTLMKSVVDTKEYGDFKVKFDIINLAFLAYKDDAFDDTRLVRFDTQWTWGNVSLTTYIFLVRAVYELANIETREKLKKTIDPKRLFDDKMTAFSAEARNNIKRYYQL